MDVSADLLGNERRDVAVLAVDAALGKIGFSPVGVKGLGEIGVVGVSAAIANAVYHATGRRIRSLPITIDQLLARGT